MVKGALGIAARVLLWSMLACGSIAAIAVVACAIAWILGGR